MAVPLRPVAATLAAVKAELDKLAYLRRLDAHTLDLSMLPAERRRFLAGVGRRLTAQALARREPERRYPILLTLVAQSAVDLRASQSLWLASRRPEVVARHVAATGPCHRCTGGRQPGR